MKWVMVLASSWCVWKWTKSAGGRSGELEGLMEENTLPAKLPFTVGLLGVMLDNANLINEHQSGSKNDGGVATMPIVCLKT